MWATQTSSPTIDPAASATSATAPARSQDHVLDAKFRAAAVGTAVAGDREFMTVELEEESTVASRSVASQNGRIVGIMASSFSAQRKLLEPVRRRSPCSVACSPVSIAPASSERRMAAASVKNAVTVGAPPISVS